MKYFYTFLAILAPFSIFAQSNYHAGYVIQSNGDTLRGYINYREWDQTPKAVEFKQNAADKQVLEFNPETSKKIQIDGLDTYVTYKGWLSTGNINLDNLPDHIDTTKKIMSVFLKQAATGKYLTLYSQTDGLKTRYLVADGDASPIELKYYPYFSNSEVAHADIYKGQLRLHISKFTPVTDALSRQIENAKYELRDFEPIINAVNGQNNNTNKKSGLRLFAGLAANSTKTVVTGVDKIDGPRSYTGVTPKLNLGMDIFGNANVQKFIIRMELSFSYIKPNYHFSADPGYNIASVSVVDYKFTQTTVSLTPQLLYNFYNTNKLKVYADAGFGLNLSGYSNHALSSVNTNTFGTVTKYSTNDPYIINSFWASIPLQAGVVLNNKIEIYFSFAAKSNISVKKTTIDLFEEKVSNQAMNLGLKYLFK